MAINKVEYYGLTLLDLTKDTVTADKMLQGYTAHNSAGEIVTGNMTVQAFRVGSDLPSDAIGNDGDIYFQIG